MEQTHPLFRFAELLYGDETANAARTEELRQFLDTAPQPVEKIRSLIAEASATDGYAAFHAARFVDQVRALAALRCRAGEGTFRVLDIGVAPVTPLYAKLIDDIELQTSGLRWPTPAEDIARKFGSMAHHYIDLEEESFAERWPDLGGRFDAVLFCEVIEHVRASPQEMVADLIWLLRPGGHAVISTPNAFSREWVSRLLTGRKTDTVYTRAERHAHTGRHSHVREYTPLELREAIAAAGGETVHEGLFDWYGDPSNHPLQQVSARQAMMFVVRQKSEAGASAKEPMKQNSSEPELPDDQPRVSTVSRERSLVLAPPIEVASEAECIWYHTFTKPNGSLIRGPWDYRHNVDDYLGHLDFRGKSVLEVGPASGFLTIAMEQRGAAVTAIDVRDDEPWEPVPRSDRDVAGWMQLRGPHILKHKKAWWYSQKLFGGSADISYCGASALTDLADVLHFDVFLIGAILQHLRHPMDLLWAASKIADQVVVTERFVPKNESAGAVAEFLPARNNDVIGSWWQLSSEAITNAMNVFGFERTSMRQFDCRLWDLHSADIELDTKREVPMFNLVFERG